MLFGLLLLSILIFETYGGAIAKFGGSNGIEGGVYADDGYLIISLNISGLAGNNYSGVPGNSSCFDGGIKFHIHEKWDYDSNTDMLGEDECGSTYTGGHWDPWLACGSATGNTYCRVKGGCVNGSSVLSNSDGYQCSSSNFDSNPYSCEVGDWNGKYGLLSFTNEYGYLMGYSPYEVDSTDLQNFSVVFHCNSGQRAFCSAFELNSTLSLGLSRPTQGSADFGVVAYFEELDSTMIMAKNGTNLGYFDISSLTLPSDCGNKLYYRIYEDWDASGYSRTSNCSDYVGSFYDPSVSCAPGSGSIYCDSSSGELCSESGYNYTCNYDSDAGSRFLCAPGDLSGKFGSLDISGSDTEFLILENDPLMIDLDLIDGRSLVLQCSDTWEIVACAGFMSYDNSSTTAQPTTTNNSTDSSSSSDSDNAFTISIQFATIFIVFSTLIKIIF